MANATFQDFQSAIQGFNKSVTEYATNTAIQSATQQVNELNAQNLDEAQRRQQTEALGRNLALQLSGIGADPAQIQSAFSAIAPAPVKTYSDLYGQGVQKESDTLKKQATDWRNFETDRQMQLARLKVQQSSINAQKKIAQQSNTAFAKLVPQVQDRYNKRVKPLQDKIGQISTVMSLSPSSITDRIALTTMVKSVGQDVGNIGEKEAEAILGPTGAGKFMEFRNFVLGDASTIRTPQQAARVQRVFKQSKDMMTKLVQGLEKSYAYQLRKSGNVIGVDITDEEALGLLSDPMSSESADSGGGGGQPPASAQTATPEPSLDSFLRKK